MWGWGCGIVNNSLPVKSRLADDTKIGQYVHQLVFCGELFIAECVNSSNALVGFGNVYFQRMVTIFASLFAAFLRNVALINTKTTAWPTYSNTLIS